MILRSTRFFFLLALSIFLCAADRPKIGLALEGGAALGFAHIGVIEWLERNHIPIDAIAGTSMGGLVGGLYSSGMTTEEIRDLLQNADWTSLLGGRVAYPDLAFRRKEDRIAFPNHMQLGLDHGIQLPEGLNAGHALSLLFDRKLISYYGLKSFDELPIPFRCVATNLNTGQKKVFSDGSLPLALRATMSIPGAFTPLTIGGETYVDGGALDNLPVDIARQMGVDIVIAVYLNTNSTTAVRDASFLKVIKKTIQVMVAANELESLKNADILVTANLQNVKTEDYHNSEEIIPLGYAAAEEKRAVLSRFALPESDWKAVRSGQLAKKRDAIPTPEFITSQAPNHLDRLEIEKKLEDLTGKPLETAVLERKLTHLEGLELFDVVNYEFLQRGSKFGLDILAVEKSLGPPVLKLGIDVDGSDTSDIRFGVSARLINLNFGSRGAELRTDAAFGSTYRLGSEYFRPLRGGSHFFVAPRASVFRYPFDIYSGSSRLSQFTVNRYAFGADVGYQWARNAELRVGEELAWYSDKLRIGSPILPSGTQRVAISTARFQYLGTDDTVLPRQGAQVTATTQRFSSRPSGGGFTQSEVLASAFQRINRNGSIFAAASGGTSYGTTGLGLQTFTLGGPLRLGAYGRNELLGNEYFLLQSGYEHELFHLSPLFGETVSALGFVEVGRVGRAILQSQSPLDGSAALVAKTAIGPVFVGGSLSGARKKWWFGVGRIF